MSNLSRNTRAWLAVISCAAGIFWSGALIFGFPGFLSDRIGGRTTGCIAFVAATIGYTGLNFSTSFVLIMIFAACVGYGFGTMFAISAPVLTDIYGIKYFGLIFGLVFMSYGFLGGILGPNLYGVVLQSTGSYHPVFIYLGIFALISAIMIRFVKPLKKK